MTPQPITVNPTDTLTRVLYLLNRYNLSRLPVTSGGRLVGIITRSDIIRAESDRLNSVTEVGPQSEPSYVVYQSRVPAAGRGRLLVPLANPQTTETLLQLAAAIAKERHYELECLQVVLIPRNLSLTETPVDLSACHHLLSQAVRLGQDWQIPVHTQVRLAHDVAQAILETIKQQHIDLTLMGWKGSTATPARVFGSTVDTVIRQAACKVVLVKLSSAGNRRSNLQSQLTTDNKQHRFNRWLVPIAGGPNAQEAVRLLPALVSVSNEPQVRLCQVFQSTEPTHDTTVLEQAARFLKRHLSSPVLTMPVSASSVPEAVIELAQKYQCDVIVLGASRERLLQQAIKGNIPEVIAHNCDCTVIVVRVA